MSSEILNSQRRFQVWKYTVGHSQLLLRSTKYRDFKTRIDVYFKGVEAFHLPAILTGLTLSEAAETEVALLCNLQVAFGKEVKVFKAEGIGFVGYVAAKIALCHEDEGDYDDPSFFDKDNIL